jgi:hypothetical protein
MKRILTLFFVVFSITASAQENIVIDENDLQEQEIQAFHGRTVSEMDKEDLPYPVQRMIANSEFRKWDIVEVFRITGGLEGQASYIIVVSRRDNSFALYYNEDGKLIRQEMLGFIDSEMSKL